jgi:hypothetical protein
LEFAVTGEDLLENFDFDSFSHNIDDTSRSENLSYMTSGNADAVQAGAQYKEELRPVDQKHYPAPLEQSQNFEPHVGIHALQEYQNHLMFLEQQNKKRALMARQEDTIIDLDEKTVSITSPTNFRSSNIRDSAATTPTNFLDLGQGLQSQDMVQQRQGSFLQIDSPAAGIIPKVIAKTGSEGQKKIGRREETLRPEQRAQAHEIRKLRGLALEGRKRKRSLDDDDDDDESESSTVIGEEDIVEQLLKRWTTVSIPVIAL